MGTHVCQPDCSFTGTTCAPPTETCNGLDDDCDGTPDNGLACRQGSVTPCTTTCGTTGTSTCSATCTVGACVPPAEICGNMIDDNCNGMTDEGCTGCGSCPGSTPVSGSGGRFTVALGASSTTTGSCGGSGPEAALNFVLSAASDVLITTHGASVNTVVYVRSCACNGVEVGCNDDADGRTTSALHLTNLPAGSYNVFVDTNGAASGSVTVDLYIDPTGMAGDRCGNAQPILSAATSVSGSTCGLTNDYDTQVIAGAANCPYTGDGDGPERVYYFYVPTARTVSIAGCNAGSNYDQVVYIRSACNDATLAAEPYCNDDGCTGSRACTASVRSSGSVMLNPGLYYLFVDGYNDPAMAGYCQCGNFQFNLTGF
jgi:hypothetical protein